MAPAPNKPARSSRLKRGGAVAALAIAFTTAGEGVRQVSYPDPATKGHPWTICMGHTGPDVHPGMKLAMDECKVLLLKDLEGAAVRIESCIPSLVTGPGARYVAVLSLAHNIGAGGVCKSSIASLLNQGRVQEACDFFPRYNRAAGVVFPGLTKRRLRERELCLREE